MKTKLLFIMNNMQCGGAEKSLILLLEELDYTKVEVDLLLFKEEGLFLSHLPKQVHVLAAPPEYEYFDMSIKTALIDCIKKRKFRIAWNRIRAGIIFRREKNRARCEQKVWHYIARSLQPLAKSYDAAIGYMEKSPVYYCVDKVAAKRKIGFIHTDYNKLNMDAAIDMKFFKQLDVIVTVSEESVRILKERFPMYAHKIELMHHLISPATVRKMALEHISIQNEGISIVSVGRLIEAKGFDLAIEACHQLRVMGYNITWYIIGEGEHRQQLEQLIKQKGLEQSCLLLGLKENPYPYIKQCDIYAQTSRYEGRCLTVTEAKILHKPIVSTDFDVIYDQIQHGHNGLIVNQTALAISDGISNLIDNDVMRNYFIKNLKKEMLDSKEDIQKLYRWIS